jgi:hypothetical protein
VAKAFLDTSESFDDQVEVLTQIHRFESLFYLRHPNANGRTGWAPWRAFLSPLESIGMMRCGCRKENPPLAKYVSLSCILRAATVRCRACYLGIQVGQVYLHRTYGSRVQVLRQDPDGGPWWCQDLKTKRKSLRGPSYIRQHCTLEENYGRP